MPVLSSTDSDKDGISDVNEGLNDADNDGIPDYLDNSEVSNKLPIDDEQNILQTVAGNKLMLGNIARLSKGLSANNVAISKEDILGGS